MPLVSKRFQATSYGEIAYLEAGDPGRPPVLFVHGIPTSSYLWRDVLAMLKHDFRCIAPDLMGLGDSRVDPRREVFHMEAQAEMLEELMVGLGHETFSVVCHDQGGAAAQLLAARRPDRLRALVLTDCVCYDNWPVPVIAALQRFLGLPWLAELVERSGWFELQETQTPWSIFRASVHDRSKLSDEAILEYLRPLRESAASRARFNRFLLAGSPRPTLAAVPGLRCFDKPTLVLWAGDDRRISPSWGKRLAEEIPGCLGFDLVPFCGHFWQEERPAEFASKIGTFLAAHGAAA